jgi:hypothetical protein
MRASTLADQAVPFGLGEQRGTALGGHSGNDLGWHHLDHLLGRLLPSASDRTGRRTSVPSTEISIRARH